MHINCRTGQILNEVYTQHMMMIQVKKCVFTLEMVQWC